MNKKLIFRIIGALSAALIIAAVFLPYINVVGFSRTLWDYYDDTIYLPILILVFGIIAAVFFALNIKTEFAYMSSGAVLFFIVTTTIDDIRSNVFSSLGISYYLLVIGTISTAVMAFLLNLKEKNKQLNVENDQSSNNQSIMLNQIDRLYNNDQPVVDSSIQPIAPISPVAPIAPVGPISPVAPLPSPIESQPIPSIGQDMAIQPQINGPIEQINPSLQPQLNQSQTIPVVQQINEPMNTLPVNPNPVIQEFGGESNIAMSQPVNVEPQVQAPIENVQPNPVVSEFMSDNPTFNLGPSNSTVSAQPTLSPASAPTQNQVDIFGQPVNR